MSHTAIFQVLGNAETVLCFVALFFLWKNGVIKEYAYLASLLGVKVLTTASLLPVLYLAHHGLNHRLAYNLYFYPYWASFAIQAILWLMVIYSMFKLAMAPLPGLQKLGMLVFRWAAAISAVVTIAMAFAPHTSSYTMIQAAVTQLQQTSSILTLCLLLFVTFAIRPLGLTYGSRIFGVSLGMGILATSNLIGAAWLGGRKNMYDVYDLVEALCALTVMVVWSTYFALPEPKRGVIMLPTTSPFLRWNQISLALGGSPGYVAVGNVTPDIFAGAELEMMRRVPNMKVTEINNDHAIAV